MATNVSTNTKTVWAIPTDCQDYFKLPPSLPIRNSFGGVRPHPKTPDEWCLPEELREELSLPAQGTVAINCSLVPDDEDLIFPIFSPLRYVDEVEQQTAVRSPDTVSERTSLDSSSSISSSDSDTDWDTESESPDYYLDSTSDNSKAHYSRKEEAQTRRYAEDDIAVRPQCTRSVDFVTQRWSMEEAKSSWSEIRSNRNAYRDNVRLEYTLWRGWTKWANNLKTVSPKIIAWDKDGDITWLYGPTGPAPRKSMSYMPTDKNKPTSPLAGQPGPKSILKHRSLYERIVQKSLFKYSLKRATIDAPLQHHKRGHKSCTKLLDDIAQTRKVRFSFSGLE